MPFFDKIIFKTLADSTILELDDATAPWPRPSVQYTQGVKVFQQRGPSAYDIAQLSGKSNGGECPISVKYITDAQKTNIGTLAALTTAFKISFNGGTDYFRAVLLKAEEKPWQEDWDRQGYEILIHVLGAI